MIFDDVNLEVSFGKHTLVRVYFGCARFDNNLRNMPFSIKQTCSWLYQVYVDLNLKDGIFDFEFDLLDLDLVESTCTAAFRFLR